MSGERYDVSLDELERGVRTTAASQVELQGEPRLPPDGLLVVVPPFGDGATGADGD